jgi:hypothetical protein
MAHKQVLEAQGLRRLQELLAGHDGIRANVGTAELRVMVVMVIVRASPNAAGAEDQNTKEPHQPLRQPGMRQYGLMLLIVIDDEKPKNKQAREQTAQHPAGQMEIPERPRDGRRQKGRSGKQIRPTPHRGVGRVWLGRQYDFSSRSHAGSGLARLMREANPFSKSPFVHEKNLPSRANAGQYLVGIRVIAKIYERENRGLPGGKQAGLS